MTITLLGELAAQTTPLPEGERGDFAATAIADAL